MMARTYRAGGMTFTQAEDGTYSKVWRSPEGYELRKDSPGWYGRDGRGFQFAEKEPSLRSLLEEVEWWSTTMEQQGRAHCVHGTLEQDRAVRARRRLGASGAEIASRAMTGVNPFASSWGWRL